MTWDAYHRRKNALNSVIAVADSRTDGTLPWDEVPAARAAFASPADLLLSLQMHWYQRLAGELDAMFGEHDRDPRRAAVGAWRLAASDLPGTRAILDAHDHDPVLHRAHRHELATLAHAAGLAGLDDPGADVLGAALRDEARAVTIDLRPPRDAVRPGWLARMRGARAA